MASSTRWGPGRWRSEKRLSDIALVGLERAGNTLPPEQGDLVSRLPGTPSEKAFLLRLGVAAVRARAGRTIGSAPLGEPAPAETRPACSRALAEIVVDLCRQRELPILAEALTRLDARGLRLPAACLPDLAACKHPSLQPAAAQVAGERGRWLARHNPEWAWLGATAGEAVRSPAERKRTWEEGSLPERLAALQAVRAEAPAEGRAWVDSVWKQEKAAVRQDLLGALEIGLAADDEPLLERALADRAAPVRALAAGMLARLPTSALAARMRSRGEALLGRGAGGALELAAPGTFPPDWAADALLDKPPAGMGKRAFWTLQVLALVPPAHWERHLGAPPERLVAEAAGGDWSEALLAGWLGAAVRFRSAAWAGALWRGYAARASAEDRAALAARLLPLLDRAEAEALALPLVGAGDPEAFLPVLAALPAPWGPALGETFLAALARALEVPGSARWPQVQAWRASLERAAIALPGACFERALRTAPAEDEDLGAGPLRSALSAFHTVITIRKRIHEETRP